MRNEYLECGQITRAHGINGAMLINHFCDSYESFAKLKKLYIKNGDSYAAYKVKKCSPYKNSAMVVLEGIDTPEQVVAMRTVTVYAHRDDFDLDEGDFFIADLIGLPVINDCTGQVCGILKDVTNQGAQDLYVIEREGRADAYIPAIPQFVKEISLDTGIVITPIEGMLD